VLPPVVGQIVRRRAPSGLPQPDRGSQGHGSRARQPRAMLASWPCSASPALPCRARELISC